MEIVFTVLFELLAYALINAVGGVVARVLTRYVFADIAIVTATAATFVIGLILVRGLDLFGIVALIAVGGLVAWAVHSALNRVLLDVWTNRDEASAD
jgi:hypothetical protein